MGDVIEKIAGFTTGQMASTRRRCCSRAAGATVKLSVIRRARRTTEVEVTLARIARQK